MLIPGLRSHSDLPLSLTSAPGGLASLWNTQRQTGTAEAATAKAMQEPSPKW